MSQISQPTITLQDQIRAHWVVAVSALLALMAAAAVSLVLAIDSTPSQTSVSTAGHQPALRSDGGVEESAVAASIGSRPSAGPDEAQVASAVGTSTARPSGGPDESAVALSVSRSAHNHFGH
jgi:hypothetical protein